LILKKFLFTFKLLRDIIQLLYNWILFEVFCKKTTILKQIYREIIFEGIISKGALFKQNLTRKDSE